MCLTSKKIKVMGKLRSSEFLSATGMHGGWLDFFFAKYFALLKLINNESFLQFSNSFYPNNLHAVNSSLFRRTAPPVTDHIFYSLTD